MEIVCEVSIDGSLYNVTINAGPPPKVGDSIPFGDSLATVTKVTINTDQKRKR